MTVVSARRDAWNGGPRRWDFYNAVILTAVLLISDTTVPVSAADKLGGSAALLAMAAWYVLVGRAALYGDQDQPRRGALYLAGLFPLMVAEQVLVGVNFFLLLALCPQCFMAVPFRRAVAAAIAFNGVPLLIVLAHRDASRGDITTTATIAVLGVAFSAAFGSWVTKIIEQNVERAELIEELEATRAELAAAEREAGTLAERARLGSEIHDTIAQGFASIVMLVQAAEAALHHDPAQATRHLRLVAETARENLAEARALVAGLGPAQLVAGTLGDALARLACQAGTELGGGASFEVRGLPRSLGTGAEVVLLRVCQEALSNVRKHATAQSASVLLTYRAAEVTLEICDDGSGFDLAEVNGGYGLRGMRSRAGDAGGTLAVHSSPGNGTRVSVAVPG